MGVLALDFDSLQENGRWFVRGVLEDECAGEAAGEERGRERVHLSLRLRQPRSNLVGRREQDAVTVFGV
jgi:hypothetical protein